MSFMAANEKWRIGIGSLDHEHSALGQLLEALHTAVNDNPESGHSGVLLHSLDEQMRAHFSTEEAMMEGDRYPGMAIHAMKHDHLIKQLHALMVRVDQAPSNLNEHALKFLREWFQTHIEQDDKLFGVWLSEHGKS
jgi:hemerythrin-like metal-binding protein